MAIKKEQQEKTLANRIGVNRGAGFNAAINSANQAARDVEVTINSLTTSAEKYLTRTNAAAGKKLAQEQEFGSKTISYEDDNGKVHNMEMIVPVPTPDFQSVSKQEAYDAVQMTMYNDAVKNSLEQIVDETAVESVANGATMLDFQNLTENKTSIYIDELPKNFRQVARNHVNNRLSLKAPIVHGKDIERKQEEMKLNIEKMQSTLFMESFDATIMNNQEGLLSSQDRYEEIALFIQESNHYVSPAHKKEAMDTLKSNFALDKKINELFGNSLSHDPSDPMSGNLLATKSNMQALMTLLTNPSVSEVTIQLDEKGKTKVIKRSDLRNSIPSEDWYTLSKAKSERLKPLITMTKTNAAKLTKINETIIDINNKFYEQKNSDLYFQDETIRGIITDRFKEEENLVEIDDQKYMELMYEKEGIIPDIEHKKLKRFLNNPSPENVEETTRYMIDLVGSRPDYMKNNLGLTDEEYSTFLGIKSYMGNQGMSLKNATAEVAKNQELNRDMTSSNIPAGLVKALTDRGSTDLNTAKKLNDYISKIIVSNNDDQGFFGTDEATMVDHAIVAEIKREVGRSLLHGPISEDAVEEHVIRILSDIRDGRHSRFGMSESTLSQSFQLGEDVMQPAIVSDRAEYTYGVSTETGQSVEYILPYLKEKIKNTKRKNIIEGVVQVGDTWSESNIRLKVYQRGRNPVYHVYYADNDMGIRQIYSDDEILSVTKDEFFAERQLFESYMRLGNEETFEEWRANNG